MEPLTVAAQAATGRDRVRMLRERPTFSLAETVAAVVHVVEVAEDAIDGGPRGTHRSRLRAGRRKPC